MLFSDRVYEVNGKYWDIALAQYVDEPDSGKTIVELIPASGGASEEYLIETLKFYNLPLGQFGESEEEEISEADQKIAELSQKVAELTALVESFQTSSSTFSTETSDTSNSTKEQQYEL